MTSATLEQLVHEALERVYDPCSIATQSPLNIVDMGLVRRLSVDEDANVEVAISPTAPSCVLIASIVAAAEDEIRGIEGVTDVSVSIDSEFFWTPEAMTERGEELLAAYRADRLRHAPKPLGQRRRPARPQNAHPVGASGSPVR